jgi:hypothetical protein
VSRAFVIRPFGTREGVDFEATHRLLIAPVLQGLGFTGGEARQIVAAGNIRVDMFTLLLAADLVVADISIHNANVYYELGIRHALRDRTTVLIRARIAEVPFDLKTDRYLTYDPADPAAAQADLEDAIRKSDAYARPDSPVFLLLPGLPPVDPERVQPVPREFTEEVEQAAQAADLPRLALLGEEAEGFDWAVPGLRLVGAAQYSRKAWRDARATWETVRTRLADDREANLKLATVLQRLGDFAASSAAIGRLLGGPSFAGYDRAEALALTASNSKTLWTAAWQAVPAAERTAAALRSPLLAQARDTYDKAFSADQNHWYAGLNALALIQVTLVLAEQQPRVWADQFATDDEADQELLRLAAAQAKLVPAIQRSLDAADERRTETGDPPDVWLELTRADLAFLQAERAGRVRTAYAAALVRGNAVGEFPAEAAARQIRLYRDLGLFAEVTAAALDGLGVPDDAPPVPGTPRSRTIVFAGHRVDDPGRPRPRFPRTPEAESTAARMIAEAVAAERELARGPVAGLAGGASGGDILFHEACRNAGIPTTLMLAVPREAFAVASVNPAGAVWTERYRRLCDTGAVKVLSESAELPRWLRVLDGYSVWQRNSRWMLHTALSPADTDVTLIVLWDGASGDGPGGTADIVGRAEERGVKVVRLDATRLLGS